MSCWRWPPCPARRRKPIPLPIRLVVSIAAGGGIDLVARLIGQKLSEAWNPQVVIDNRPGAGGNVSAEMVAKSPIDSTVES